ncbi:MAG: 1-(5-phosphoribosyl)-5-[(5-phosphoribosylamino)methylideneamino]imidazole-4-carboxamide isomerase [Acholeplasmataceae bacterium]|nr:1-(5-phosphoribosyl)-5-[(5-phosphoribosylamino)methylideneamino]imidazole-4-carboxamide isomerase [Acholeplasmataceae bacterium]
MIIFPAIDLKDGLCVRLSQGKFDSSIVYSNSPLEIAKRFEKDGAEFIHIVDLNGAEKNNPINFEAIKSIVENINIPIQVGGGIRSMNQAQKLLDIGVSRIIIGTSAIEDFELLERLVEKYQERVIVSIDAYHQKVFTRGWKTETDVSIIDLSKKLEKIGIKTIVYTDISKDGMMQGPNFDDYIELSKKTNLKIIASGGVSELKDVLKLNEIGLYGAIIGKALYESKINLKEVIACLQNE